MRKGKKNKSEENNAGFRKNKAFENKEIAGIDTDADHYDDFAPGEVFDSQMFCEDIEATENTELEYAEMEDLEQAADIATVATLEAEKMKVRKPDGKAADEDNALPTEDSVSDDSIFHTRDGENGESGQEEHETYEVPAPKKTSEHNGFFQLFFITFYNFFYRLGLQNFRYGKRILTRLGRLLMRPVRYTFALSRVFVLGVDRLFFRSMHALHEEFLYFRKEIKSSTNYLRRAFKENPLSGFSIIWHYTKRAFKTHKDMFRTALNLGIPAVALLVLWATVSHWNSVTYALQLTYNDAKIGFIQDEAVYIQAQGLVNEQLGIVLSDGVAADESVKETELAESEKEEEKPSKPTYELALVSLAALSDEATLSDNLIENSAEKLTAACGIFINGEFIAAVKNETDATRVFDNLLAPYKTDDPLINAAFVEDVRFTQGLYSDKTKMMDAQELQEKLSTKKTEAVYYTIKNGDTIWSVAMKFRMTESALLQLNPNQNELIKTGDTLKVSNDVNFVRVKLVKTEVRSVEVPFETIKTDNPKLFRGDTRIVRKGVPGKETVTELVTYIDDVRVSAQEVDRKRVSDPVAQKTDVGTKSTKVSGSSGSYNVKVSNVGFVWPVPGYYNRVSSPFGYRNRGFHSGVDISGPGINGKVIVAAKDGVVESVGTGNSGLGNRIVINHGGGVKTRYGHCLSGSISVSPGQHVSAGQAIARVGSTGNSTGPHLHFEVVVNGSAVNPLPYIR